jgi:hypothetical protein
MDGSFEDRRRAAEAKWAHDAETRFKVMARRDRLLGQWAAYELGLRGTQMEAYAKSVVQGDVAHHDDGELLNKLRADFGRAKVGHSNLAIQQKMDELLVIAGEQVLSETGNG